MTSFNLNGNGDGGYPSLKFPYSKVGDCTAVIGMANIEERQATDFKTGQPALTQSGKPKMEWIVTGILVSGGYTENEVIADPTKGIGPDDAKPPVAGTPGDVVRLYVGSWNKYNPDDPNHSTWSVAAQKIGGNVNPGDLLQVAFNRTVHVGDGLSARKVLDFAWRHFDPAKDGDLRERCMKLHNELTAAPSMAVGNPEPFPAAAEPAAVGATFSQDAF